VRLEVLDRSVHLVNRAIAPSLLVAALGLAIAGARHNDDGDAVLYTVVTRNMVHDGTWFDLTYTPNVHAHFREHLPFGFWPGAVVTRVFGEGALPWLGALWSLLTVALVAEVGRRLGGVTMGALAGFLLATTEQFIVNGAANRLDPPLVFFAMLAAAPVLVVPKRSFAAFALTLFAAALAALIKGPFGLVPLVGAAIARAVMERDWKWLPWGAAATLLATVPVIGFLLHERSIGSDWWSGYVEAQLLASATGARTDGESAWWFPLASIGARFWPWLPLVAVGLWRARRERTARLTLIWLVLSVLALMLPSRKLWHHVLIAFPALVLTASTSFPLPSRGEGQGEGSNKRLTLITAVITLGTLAFVAFGHRGRTVACTDFAPELAAQPANAVVIVGVTEQKSHWREIGVVASEFHLRPWMAGSPPEMNVELGTEARLALVPEAWPLPPDWHEVRVARGWRLLAKSPN
jgi:4-amino-4-deoxy-L-arabinose transferase-like glycosyltransferase